MAALSARLAPTGASAGQTSKVVAKQAQNATLGRSVLTTTRGLTLYSLSAERPEGKVQVSFKGRPLYRFNGDSKAGDANGEGIKDVGTWHAAAISRLAPPPQPQNPYGYSWPRSTISSRSSNPMKSAPLSV